MKNLLRAFQWLANPSHWSGYDGIATRLTEHLWLTALSLMIAAVVALPVGVLIGHTGHGAFLVITVGNSARALPTLGVLIMVVLGVGIGVIPALVALVVLAVPPILTTAYAGVRAVDPAVVDAAQGMGLTGWQIVRRVEIPLAMPLLIAGFRTATLMVISTATIAAYVALGGLGRFIVDGYALQDYPQMLGGGLLVAAMAVTVDLALAALQRQVTSPGVSRRERHVAVAARV
jgi:osmoprotectant transport system permease protein